MFKTRLKSLAIVAALGATVAAAPASAAPSPSTDRDDCVGGPSGTVRCFDTFREAIASASGGRLTDAPKSARQAARDPRVRRELRSLGAAPTAAPGAAAATTRRRGATATRGTTATPRAARADGEIIAATLFDDQGFGGGSYTVTAGAPCKKDGLIEWQIDLPQEWQDRVSSVQPWGNCWIWLYPDLGLGGDRDGPFKENTTYVGARLDNRTKSVGLS